MMSIAATGVNHAAPPPLSQHSADSRRPTRKASSTTPSPLHHSHFAFLSQPRPLRSRRRMSTQKRTATTGTGAGPAQEMDLPDGRRTYRQSIDELRQQGHLSRRGTKQRKMVTQDASGRQISYHDYIAQTWGRTAPDPGSRRAPATSRRRFSASTVSSPCSPQLSPKERRPKIHVTIPQGQVSARQAVHKPIPTTASAEGTPSTVSPPSTTTRAYEIAPARLSVVSPLSVVEMPRPRRPFSTHSIENMSRNMPNSAPPAQTHMFDASAERTDRSSHYSQSSGVTMHPDDGLNEPADRVRASVTFSICSPTAAGVFDETPAVPQLPPPLRDPFALNDAVKNKPLPPEPGLAQVTPLALSRISGLSRRNSPAPLRISRTSTLPSCRVSTISSLRSKYSPTDLDKLDEVFQRISPLHLQSAGSHPSRTLRQAEIDLEAHLGMIEEHPGVVEEHPVMLSLPSLDDPLQIKRGAGTMEPSRPAPLPPGCVASPKKRFPKRAASHIVSMIRSTDANARGRESRNKAQRVLGEDPGMLMERQGSVESNWSSSECQSPPNSSPNASTRGDTTTPETDVSSLRDQTYDDVKARLDLLSPTEDASTTFLAIRGALEHSPDANHDPFAPARSHPTHTVPEIVVAPLQISSPPPHDLKPVPTQGRRRDAKSVRSLASIAASEIRDLYASLPSPVPSLPPLSPHGLIAAEMEHMISADAAERVLLRILENMDNLQDLFSTATVSRGFYRTFKRHELSLMKNALFSMSAAAWELRETCAPGAEHGGSSGYTPTTYLQDYMRDMYTMIALKSMILIHCESFLRADTITALAGGESNRAAEIDDAFWRIWTFCKLFGHGTGHEDDIVRQMDWLKGGPLEQESGSGTSIAGFGRGNKDGLSADALYDVTEIWTCMGVLVRGLQAKRELAREYGVFDQTEVAAGDAQEEAVLEEWTYHILTLAPPAVLDVTGPASPTAATFAHARSRGYTDWAPPTFGASRSTFLKEAVSRVYEERMAARRYIPTTQSPIRSGSISPEERRDPATTLASRQRCANHAAQIRRARQDPNFRALPPSEDRPMSNWPDIFDRLDYSPPPPMPDFSPSRLSQATLFPDTTLDIYTPNLQLHHHQQQQQQPHRFPRGPQELTIRPVLSTIASFASSSSTNGIPPAGPQVRDPVDVAIDRLVAMGFDAKKAAKALADTDNGNGIDFDQAVEVLVRERKRDVNNMMHWGYRGRKEQQQQQQQQGGGGGGHSQSLHPNADPNLLLGGDTLIGNSSAGASHLTGLGSIGRSASGGPPVRYD